jgi:ribonuclease P protein component
VIASRRCGNAVHRNRAKRWMRSLFVQQGAILPPNSWLVMIARHRIHAYSFAQMQTIFCEALSRFTRIS